MSLEDKFYPEDGTMIRAFDNWIIKKAGKVGEYYQHMTGRSYRDTVRGVYGAAAVAFGTAAAAGDPIAGTMVFIGLLNMVNPRIENPLEERLRNDLRFGYERMGCYMRAMFTCLAASIIIPYVNKLMAGNLESIKIVQEGGLTCHAAIISRELGIPCVVGTKVATRMIKDGDEIEVNANHGVIKII
ncbi:PEP-utilizing enzyme [Nanoarchaeota archaeon]